MGCSGSKSALSANNSYGASIAAVELSSALGDTFSEINLQGNVNEQIRELLQRLDHEVSKYVNSKVDEDKSPEWHPSQAEVQLISAAWKCAHGTYNLEGTITNTSYCTFRREKALRESFAGTVKVITSTVVEPTSDDIGKSDMLPGLILAIRGSASKMDHIVNANSRPQPTGGFITFDKGKGQKPHIIFTGHSAGGAVSQILYLKYISNQAFNESARFSCATFGAPPCVTAPIDLSFYHPGGKTLCLNIINEFDVVTRADKPYILSLVDIARNMLNQPPKALLPEPETSSEIIDASLKATQDKEAELSSPKHEESHNQFPKTWHFSQPLYNHIGPSVVLLMRSEDEMKLKAVEVTPAEFQKLLFCRTAVHGKRIYEKRVEALEQGHFNDETGWQHEDDED
ncbi:alpha beta-hydrolase [Fusarium sporotrichioides]|uniref:Alpha beta-hydrolase n=1 Tax=Fusarium sporotrichioides TaxID=5514 RepID=A0A395S5A3_FUSSP|nr:alpha beta-hydrolase [Fusarium sporotrichioides]